MSYSKEQVTTYITRALLVVVCILPIIIILYSIFVEGVPRGQDYNAHMLRLVSLSNEIKYNQFPYVFDYWNQQGIGFSWQLFYPPLTNIYLFISTYFFPFFNEIAQLKLTLLQIILVNFSCAFYAGKRQYNSILAGLLCAGILFSSYYYISLIFIRFAISELSAIGFLILFIRGLNSLITDQKDKFLIPISSPLIVLASIPIAIATIFFCIVYFIIFYRKITNRYTILFLTKSLIICSLISSIYLLPLYFNTYGDYIYMSSNAIFSYKIFTGTDLFNLLWGASFFPISLGVIYNLEIIRKTLMSWRENKLNFLLFIVLILSSSSIFPWWIIPDKLTSFNIMQFPWRIFSTIICFASLWLASIALEKKYMYCTLLIVLSLLINPLNSDNITILKDQPINKNLVYKDYLNNNALTNVNTPIYQPIDYNPFNINKRDYTIKSKVFNNGFPKYTIETKQDMLISIPLVYYRSVTAYIDEIKQNTQYMSDGSIGLNLKKGTHIIQIGYNSTYNFYSIILCITGYIFLIYIIVRDKRKVPSI